MNSIPVYEVARSMGVSKSTAYRDIKHLTDCAVMHIADVTQWRPNSDRHWYTLTRVGAYWLLNYRNSKRSQLSLPA